MTTVRRPVLTRWTKRYEQLLKTRRASGRARSTTDGEAPFEAAYNLGRDAIGRGAGVLELVEAYGHALARLCAADARQLDEAALRRATRVLLESLVPFEITHRGYHEVHAALGASRERYGELVDNANDVIFSCGMDGRLTSLNRAGERLLGYSREEAKLLNIDALFASPKVRRMFAKYRLDRDAKKRRRCEIEVIARDGRLVPLDLSTRLVVEQGRPVGIQGIARDITHRKQAESALRHLNQRLEEKAKRIAHALHDEAGQLLASVYLKIAEIGKAPTADKTALTELRGLLDQVSEQVRHLAHELRPSVLDDLGLIPACEFLADGVSRRFGVTVNVYGSTGGRLPPALETALYRISQEALTNGVKHGRAGRMVLEFRRRRATITGKIWDDGTGFDVKAALGNGHVKEKGLGLVGMRQRLVELGGTLSITSRPGHGTTIEFQAPVGASDAGISVARG